MFKPKKRSRKSCISLSELAVLVRNYLCDARKLKSVRSLQQERVQATPRSAVTVCGQKCNLLFEERKQRGIFQGWDTKLKAPLQLGTRRPPVHGVRKISSGVCSPTRLVRFLFGKRPSSRQSRCLQRENWCQARLLWQVHSLLPRQARRYFVDWPRRPPRSMAALWRLYVGAAS